MIVKSSPTLRRWLIFACTVCFGGLSLATGSAEAQLGSTDFPNSGSAAAQEPFLEGLLYLHSFEYESAKRAFVRAQEIDPDFAMAYWGEAMTYNHPLWLEEKPDAAREALARLASTPEERLAKASTEREKAYLRAIEILWGDGEKRDRDHNYAAAMAALSASFPEDLDAAAFHALALLGTCHDGRDVSVYMRAAAILEEVFAANPRHPGAAHYLIHCYDDAPHAPLGLRPARIYAEIAPDAVHALHMPSHIFLALGMWDETVDSNIDSFEAGERKVERLQLAPDRRDYHGLYWMHYALLQMGRFQEAREKLDLIVADTAAHPTVRTRTHAVLMRAAHVVATEDWNLLPDGFDRTDLAPNFAAGDLFITGFSALRRGDVDRASEALSEMETLLSEVDSEAGVRDGYQRVGGVRTEVAEILRYQLSALLAARAGAVNTALAELEAAAQIEDETAFGFGPPNPAKPTRELYGEILLSINRPASAFEQFEQALRRTPRRTKSLEGLAEAARKAQFDEPARAAMRTLEEILHRADSAEAEQR